MAGEKVTNPAGTFVCLFCAGIISMRSGDNEKFRMHLELYHEVFSQFEIVLALHFLTEEEKENIGKAVEYRIEETEKTGLRVKQEILIVLEQDVDEVSCENKQKEESEHFEVGNDDETNFEENNENQAYVHESSPKEMNIDEKDNENLDEPTSFDKTVNVDKSEDAACQFCQRKFRKLKDLEKHTSNRVCLKYFPCQVCGIKFSSGANLKRHVQEVKGSCSRNPTSRDLHYEAIYLDTENIIPTKLNTGGNLWCTICNMKFKNDKCLKNHIVKKTCLKFYSCDKCDKKFHLPSRLKRHI